MFACVCLLLMQSTANGFFNLEVHLATLGVQLDAVSATDADSDLVCMCACTCMCVCMYIIMYACMHACMDGCVFACMYVCMFVCMHVYVCMYVCMYVCCFRVLKQTINH